MLVRSTLVRMSPGSQILRSAYWARDKESPADAFGHRLDIAVLGAVALQKMFEDPAGKGLI